jgi:integrin beta 3
MAPVVQKAIETATAGLMARIVALEHRQAVPGRDGRDGLSIKGDTGERGPAGPAGTSVTLEDVRPLLMKAVADAVAAMPVPKDGADGRDGKDGADGKDGRDGEKGLDGKDGADGRDGLDGKDGRDGVDGKDGMPGLQGEKGIDGRDGMDGKDGRDGIDGVTLSAEDFASMSLDPSTRTLSMTFVRGDKSVTQSCSADGLMFYRDVYSEGKTYAHGDCVTWGGSLWYAKESTSAKPGLSTDASRAWVLVAKRGAEGKQGKQGDPGPQGLKGDKGDRGPERW